MEYPLRSSTIKLQQAGPDTLVHDVARRKIHILNATAAKVLDACDGRTGVEEIARRIAPQHAAQAAHDVARIIEEFHALGLVIA